MVDECGVISLVEFDEQVDRVPNPSKDLGVRAGTNAGVLCRNHRIALIANYAALWAG